MNTKQDSSRTHFSCIVSTNVFNISVHCWWYSKRASEKVVNWDICSTCNRKRALAKAGRNRPKSKKKGLRTHVVFQEVKHAHLSVEKGFREFLLRLANLLICNMRTCLQTGATHPREDSIKKNSKQATTDNTTTWRTANQIRRLINP